MWGIAIILIGGIYWTYRVINEKTNEEVLERYRNNADEINNKIKATLDEEISVTALDYSEISVEKARNINQEEIKRYRNTMDNA